MIENLSLEEIKNKLSRQQNEPIITLNICGVYNVEVLNMRYIIVNNDYYLPYKYRRIETGWFGNQGALLKCRDHYIDQIAYALNNLQNGKQVKPITDQIKLEYEFVKSTVTIQLYIVQRDRESLITYNGESYKFNEFCKVFTSENLDKVAYVRVYSGDRLVNTAYITCGVSAVMHFNTLELTNGTYSIRESIDGTLELRNVAMYRAICFTPLADLRFKKCSTLLCKRLEITQMAVRFDLNDRKNKEIERVALLRNRYKQSSTLMAYIESFMERNGLGMDGYKLTHARDIMSSYDELFYHYPSIKHKPKVRIVVNTDLIDTLGFDYFADYCCMQIEMFMFDQRPITEVSRVEYRIIPYKDRC